MFDPSVSDPLVLEHGADDYHVAAPLDSIMQLTVYEDIAAKCFSWSVRLRVGIFSSVCLPSPSRLTPQISRLFSDTYELIRFYSLVFLFPQFLAVGSLW